MSIKIQDRRREQKLSPWVTLVTHSIKLPGWDSPQDYHSLKQADYVAMFAVTSEGRIPLVRQYRSAVGRFTLEFPAGLLEPGEKPQATAVRELFEETGYSPGRKITPLGRVAADSGRLENYQWAYFTANAKPAATGIWTPDPHVETLLVTRKQFEQLVLKEKFQHSLHMAVLAQALTRGLFSF